MAEARPRRPDWLDVREAIDRVLAAVRPLGPESVELIDALGRTLVRPIVSPVDQPPWDNSAMDGFAVQAADVRGAAPDRPARLSLIESVAAGGFPTRAVGAGQAIRINTGAPIPAGADSVVRVEHTDRWRGPGGERGVRAEQAETAATMPRVAAAETSAETGETILVFDDADAGRNVRPRGEDLRVGETVLEAGRVVRPADLGVLATVGAARVEVHRRPVVAILANGDELAGLDEFDEVIAGRRIVNSNSWSLAGAVLATGAVPRLLGIARDDRASLLQRLEAARGADVLLTAAGASVGEHDLVKDALDELGFRLDFWRVKMQPGSPVSFGSLGGMPIFGLPGNPVSAMVTFEVLVRPALRRMLGRRAVHPATVPARVAEPIGGRPGLTRFLRVRLHGEPGTLPEARLAGPQGSGILTSVARADALLVVPEAMAEVPAGSELPAIPLYPGDVTRKTIGF